MLGLLQVSALYKAVAEGITELHAQSEAGGSDVSLNPARTHFYALSGYLATNGVLEGLNLSANYMMHPEAYPTPTGGKLSVI